MSVNHGESSIQEGLTGNYGDSGEIDDSISSNSVVVKEEKEDVSLAQITTNDLEKWDEFTKSLGSSNNLNFKVKEENFPHQDISKDPFGLFTLLFWYKDESISCPEPDKQIYLNKKCVEDAFLSIGKCFVTCYDEGTGDDRKIVGCISFESELDALTALNDMDLVAKYNLEALNMPSFDQEILSDECNQEQKKIIGPLPHPKATVDCPLTIQMPQEIVPNIEPPNFFTTLRHTICKPSEFRRPYLGYQDCNSLLEKHQPLTFIQEQQSLFGYPNRNFSENSIFVNPSFCESTNQRESPNQHIPSLLDLELSDPRSIEDISSFSIKNKFDNMYGLESACQSYIDKIRWGKNNELKPKAVSGENRRFRNSEASGCDLRDRIKKKKRNYRDWDEVKEEQSELPEDDFMGKKCKWDELFALVKEQILPKGESTACIPKQHTDQRKAEVKSANSSYDEPQYYHLLVKHKFSNRPSSWREKKITRTKGEAMKNVKEYKSLIEGGSVSFKAVAAKFSDGTDLQSSEFKMFGPEKFVKLFESIVSNLKVGMLSDPVDTEEGIHILERIA